ncbi:MAG TPA: hypothetical protein VM733_11755 [Thermoanaerobaculia bacterium]|nr:hypothetical protein [Thermoanaerobaculia bacterium]
MRNALLALLILPMACAPKTDESEAEAKTESDASSVTLPAATVRQNGITVAVLQPASPRASVAIGNATVVDVTELVNAAGQIATAMAQRDGAAARLRASRAELERLRGLNADDHNVSDRAVQEAAAAAAADEASVRTAEVSASAAEASARQRWGAVLARGVAGGAPWARQLASRDAALVEVVLTTDAAPPRQLAIDGAMGRPVAARYLTVSPRVDARLQKPVHDYLAPAAELPVGFVTTIRAALPANGGALVPKSAVVWYGAQALVFVEDRPGHYVQRPVTTATPVEGGFLETTVAPGTRVVITGAQQLLSEQHKPEVE